MTWSKSGILHTYHGTHQTLWGPGNEIIIHIQGATETTVKKITEKILGALKESQLREAS